ncbi:MAG: UDP-N-acetylmuramoyl-tripeptide--D-alanyl-D-alanine ligase [Bacteroidia bacterium]|nr:UDP-N-acetylmuramoyl-tripeptide--D-alanyl-D-alanine ligase [Bacteroidia bacterium]
MKGLQIEEIYNLYIQSGGVCTDTRSITKDCTFFALKGETFNGNNFALKALEQGAMYAIVDDPDVEAQDNQRTVLVDNVLHTLQQIARYHRLKHKIPVLAITGTNGKTTTKELIAAVLQTKYNIIYTQGNLNNHIGVPLTLLRINKETQVAVIEMGASNPGEIETLVKLVCPSFGLITNIGKAHLMGFGSLEGVMKTKGELYDNLMEHKKIAFANIDNPYILEMTQKRPNMQIVPYGVKNDNARAVIDQNGSPFLRVIIPNPCAADVCNNVGPKDIIINTHLIGNYNIDNVLAALCVSQYLAIDTADAVMAISNYVPSNNRSQMTKTANNTLIVDAYNANPTSMRASVENFEQLKMSSKVLILGDMLELGEDSPQEHKNMIKLALGMNPSKIFFVGKEFATAYAELSEQQEIMATNIILTNDSLALREWFIENPLKGCNILIKGSHGIHLERLIDVL